MKLYVGSKEYKPDGYLTVDIDVSMKPDIVGNIMNLDILDNEVVDEIVASHVLEHLDWPDSFLAISEFQRVLKFDGKLKIAVPDMDLLLRMIFSGDSAFHVMGIVYGTGGKGNKFEQHRYGFTRSMLLEILEVLGFGEFDWFSHSFNDASSGWIPRYDDDHFGISINICSTKKFNPLIDPKTLYEKLCDNSLRDFSAVAADFLTDIKSDISAPKIYQRIHFKLIEAIERIKFLEKQIDKVVTERQELEPPSRGGHTSSSTD